MLGLFGKRVATLQGVEQRVERDRHHDLLLLGMHQPASRGFDPERRLVP